MCHVPPRCLLRTSVAMWHDCVMIREVPKMCSLAGVYERTRASVYGRTRANTRVSVRTRAVSRLILSWYEDVISYLCHNTSPSYCAIVSDQEKQWKPYECAIRTTRYQLWGTWDLTDHTSTRICFSYRLSMQGKNICCYYYGTNALWSEKAWTLLFGFKVSILLPYQTHTDFFSVGTTNKKPRKQKQCERDSKNTSNNWREWNLKSCLANGGGRVSVHSFPDTT